MQYASPTGPLTGYPYEEMIALSIEKDREIVDRIRSAEEARRCPKESSSTPESSATI